MIKTHSRESAKFVATFYGSYYPEHVINIDLARADKLMQSQPHIPRVLNQNQWDAVASLVLSVLQGEAHHPDEPELIGCSLFRNLGEKKFQLALSNMAEYVYFKRGYMPQLEERRKKEIKLFLTPVKTVL